MVTEAQHKHTISAHYSQPTLNPPQLLFRHGFLKCILVYFTVKILKVTAGLGYRISIYSPVVLKL